jgi:leader peptidase (prepilin peptidase)/N-methyltransferase
VETLILILVIAGGLAWGSFLNVVIHRLPREMSLVRPPSSCPGCGKRIKPYDNIPLLSYAILGGRCRSCGAKISPVYPLVEGLTAAGFVLVYVHSGRAFGPDFFAGCLFTCALVALGFIDYFHQIIPDEVTLPGLFLALAYAFFRDDLGPRDALLGAVAGSGFLLLVYGFYLLVRKKEGLGMGDVTMLLFVGAYLGLAGTILTLLLASFAGALVGVLLIFRRKKDLQFALPFGTFLAPAAFVSMIWGERIVAWYLGLYKG